MLKVILSIILSLVITPLAFAQTTNDSGKAAIEGTVYSDGNLKLSSVLIAVSGEARKYNIFTDNNGKYHVEVEPGKYSISVKHVGFADYQFKNLVISENEIKTLDIYLVEKLVSTEEIEVEGVFRQRQEDLRTSLFNIRPQNVKMLPGAVEDVLRSLQSLPGRYVSE